MVENSVVNYLAAWSAIKSRSVIPICVPEECLGCYMAGNVMCFRNGEEDRKIPEYIADSSDYHISPKPGPDWTMEL